MYIADKQEFNAKEEATSATHFRKQTRSSSDPLFGISDEDRSRFRGHKSDILLLVHSYTNRHMR